MKTVSQKTERLQVVLARHGIASRRGVVEIIEQGKVTVNGQVVMEKGFRVAANLDKIIVDGKELSSEGSGIKRYFILNKPKGVMTTLQDPHAESTVADFFRDIPERLFPVGRLDRDTTGLILMTNDGELAFRLTHPRFGVKKRYRTVVDGLVTDEDCAKIEKGIKLEEGPTAPCQVQISQRIKGQTHIYVVLHEGKKRQIRRVFQKCGYFVSELERIEYGPLTIKDLRFGQRKELTHREISALYKAAGLKK